MTHEEWLTTASARAMYVWLAQQSPSRIDPNNVKWRYLVNAMDGPPLPYTDSKGELSKLITVHGPGGFMANLIRCVFGNAVLDEQLNRPCRVLNRNVVIWNDNVILRMALTIHNDRSFSLMPVLADALEEAGMVDQEMLDHCRAEVPHCRGCWVLESILSWRAITGRKEC